MEKKEYLLPEIIDCPHCNADLLLEEKERLAGNLDCPTCKNKITEKDFLKSLSGQKANNPGRNNQYSYHGGQKFKTLLGFGMLISGLGWILIIFGFFGLVMGIGSMDRVSNLETGLFALTPLFGGIIGIIVGIGFVVNGQLISCFVSIERNTHQTYQLLESRK